MGNKDLNNKLYHVIQIAVLVAIMVVLSYVRIPIGPVPIVLENFGVMLAALLLGINRGTVAVVIFIVMRMLGLGGPGGIALLFSPVSGYIYGWVLMPLFICLLIKMFHAKGLISKFIIIGIVSVGLDDFICGGAGLMIFSHLSMTASLGYNCSFILGDAVKAFAAAFLDVQIMRTAHFRQLLE